MGVNATRWEGDLNVVQGSVLEPQNGVSSGETRAASRRSRTRAEPAVLGDVHMLRWTGRIVTEEDRWETRPGQHGGPEGTASENAK